MKQLLTAFFITFLFFSCDKCDEPIVEECNTLLRFETYSIINDTCRAVVTIFGNTSDLYYVNTHADTNAYICIGNYFDGDTLCADDSFTSLAIKY